MRYSILRATVAQVQAVGGTDIREVPRMGIIFATLTLAQVGQLLAMGCIVKEVTRVSTSQVAPPTPIAPTGVSYTPLALLTVAGLDQLRGITSPPLYGENMNIALIDSGVRETHQLVGGRVIYRKNYTNEPMADNYDHGTGVCSIIVAIAPKANILNLKVLDSTGEADDETVVVAIDDCIGFHDTNPNIAPTVINLSLGGPDDGDPNNVIRVACRQAIASNMIVVAACGNDGPAAGTIACPACERYVGAVGSIKLVDTTSFVISDFSSRGPTREGLIKPDSVWFGEGIQMASSASDSATITKSGTSFACPFGSSFTLLFEEAVARQVSYPNGVPAGFDPTKVSGFVTSQQLFDYLVPAVDVKPAGVPSGKDNSYGWGLTIGQLILNAMQTGVATPTVDFSSLISSVGGVMAIGMMGMVMSSMARGMIRRR